jgi:rhodanese-related sulfurtransferase/DNA-binding transcriptional ArsR family regulator
MRTFKDEVYGQFARIGKALASPKRLEILDLLAQGEKTVEAVAVQARLGLKNASAQLRELRSARLVEARKASPYVFYRLAGDEVHRLLRELQGVGRQRLAEIEQVTRLYLSGRDALEAVGVEELARRLESEAVVLLDVRPADEYEAGHILGALSMPVGELARRLAELPRDREVVAYCRGPYCVYAVEAVELLRSEGYAARRMESGFPEWRSSGRPVAGPARSE